MKRFFSLTLILFYFCVGASFAQTPNANDGDEKTSFYSQRYCVLHSADSNFLLKLDTRTGQIYPINMKFSAKVSIEKNAPTNLLSEKMNILMVALLFTGHWILIRFYC